MIGVVFFYDDNASLWSECDLADLKIFHSLSVSKVAQAPLCPYQVVFDVMRRMPVLKPDIINGAHAMQTLQYFGEFGHRLNNINFLRYMEK